MSNERMQAQLINLILFVNLLMFGFRIFSSLINSQLINYRSYCSHSAFSHYSSTHKLINYSWTSSVAWLTRLPVTEEITGSNPVWSA